MRPGQHNRNQGPWSLLIALLYLGAMAGIIASLVCGLQAWGNLVAGQAMTLLWPLLGTATGLFAAGCVWLARRIGQK